MQYQVSSSMNKQVLYDQGHTCQDVSLCGGDLHQARSADMHAWDGFTWLQAGPEEKSRARDG